MLAYAFMRRALVVGLMLGVVLPLMGIVVVNRRTSTVGDALSHSSLAGIGLGLIFGFSPLFGAMIAAAVAAFFIDAIRHRFPENGDMATAMVMAGGVGLASLFSDIAPTSTHFESYLFGSIFTISGEEMGFALFMSLLVLFLFFFEYYPLLHLMMDPRGARLSGVSIKAMDFRFTLLLAITVAIASRALGVLMVSSLMILPVATAMNLAKSYQKAVFASIFFGLIYVLIGVIVSYYFRIKPSGAIVILGIVVYSVSSGLKKFI